MRKTTMSAAFSPKYIRLSYPEKAATSYQAFTHIHEKTSTAGMTMKYPSTGMNDIAAHRIQNTISGLNILSLECVR